MSFQTVYLAQNALLELAFNNRVVKCSFDGDTKCYAMETKVLLRQLMSWQLAILSVNRTLEQKQNTTIVHNYMFIYIYIYIYSIYMF